MPTVDRELWQQIIQRVVINGGHIIRPWFTDLQPLALDNGLLEIQVPGPNEKDYCQKHAIKLFTDAAQEATGRLVGICFLTDASEANDLDTPDVAETDDKISGLGKVSAGFQDDYVFGTFVTGPCNRLAHAASLA
ncbi:MAG: hypothetical protein GY794_20160, partial [bacterium]|nr:hypothetical protein [bacterium]